MHVLQNSLTMWPTKFYLRNNTPIAFLRKQPKPINHNQEKSCLGCYQAQVNDLANLMTILIINLKLI